MASKINADEFVDREGEGQPTLPKGVVISGVTTITTATVAGNEVANTGGINAGIITSTHFKGNLTGDVNAGIVTVSSQTVVGSAVTISASGIDIGAGVITATSYVGSGANLTGLGATIMVWEYNPDPYDMSVPFDTGIGITFNQKIKAGSGNITLSIANAGVAGTVVENFAIGSSVTISNNELSFTPTNELAVEGQEYNISYPAGVLTNMAGEDYVGTSYTFTSLKYDRQLWAVGWNNSWGQLGLNDAVSRSSPTQIPGTNWASVAGNHAYMATKTDGTLWAWGQNNYGGLGLNSTTTQRYSSPTQVGSDTTWATGEGKIDKVYDSCASIAIKTDGTMWVWGADSDGRLGLNLPQNNYKSSPTQIYGGGTTWSTCAFSQPGGIANKTDGTLWTWGGGANGELGDGTTTNRSSPTQIPGTTWTGKIDTGKYAKAAIRSDGTLWTWGAGLHGQLGHNQETAYSSPKQVPGTTWSDIKINDRPKGNMLALKTDGTLWAWGDNSGGRLGQNESGNYYSSPVQIPGTTWNDIAIKAWGGIARKTDNTIWGWGANDYGVFQPGTPDYYSSPVQVHGDGWDRPLGEYTNNSIILRKNV